MNKPAATQRVRNMMRNKARKVRRGLKTGLVLGGALATGSVLACPVCHTETGMAVRESIFSGTFTANLLATIAPFAALALGLVVFTMVTARKS